MLSHQYQQQTLHCIQPPDQPSAALLHDRHPAAYSSASSTTPSAHSSRCPSSSPECAGMSLPAGVVPAAYAALGARPDTGAPPAPTAPTAPSAPTAPTAPALAALAALAMPATHTFPQFMALPAEIRAMVWEFALPAPRVYEVLDVPHAKQKMDPSVGLMFANKHHEPPPALAAACHESRYFVLRHYRPLTLGGTTKYVDLARDLLLLEPYLLLKRLHRTLHFLSRIPLVRTHMAGLALGTSYGLYTGICHPVLSWKASKSNMAKLLTALSKFPKLTTLLFVVHQEFRFEFDNRHYPAPQSLLQSVPTVPHPSIHHASIHQPPTPPPPTRASSPPTTPPFATAAHRAALVDQPYLPGQHPSQMAPAAQPLPLPLHPQPLPQPLNTLQQLQALQPPPANRDQVVHQAFRFKFDIEGSINHLPRRPHLNDLIFYPLQTATDDDEQDDWETLLNSNALAPASTHGTGLDADSDTTDADTAGEWSDPWPTNDDWLRFRRRFQRAVVATLQAGLASSRDGQNAFCIDADTPGGDTAGSKKHGLPRRDVARYNSLYSLHSLHAGRSTGSHAAFRASAPPSRRYALKQKLPDVRGVSVMWHYCRSR